MNRIIKQSAFYFLATIITVQLRAQDKKMEVDINLNKNDSNWYQQPWVWIVGGAVFILLLVAMLKGSGKKFSYFTFKGVYKQAH